MKTVILLIFLLLGCNSKQGPKGNKGNTGNKGDVGPQGLIGPQGEQGVIGLIGPQGLIGPIGLIGTKGVQGVKGDTGTDGKDGEDGIGLVYKEELDADPTITCIGELVKVTYGHDVDFNKHMEPEEIAGYFLWCKSKSDVELVTRSEKAPKSDTGCINGGNLIFFAEDINKDDFISDGDKVINVITICK